MLAGGQEISVTASVGVAVLDEACEFNTVEEMLEAADKAVYAAKERGRNRFVIYGDQTDTDLAQVTAG